MNEESKKAGMRGVKKEGVFAKALPAFLPSSFKKR